MLRLVVPMITNTKTSVIDELGSKLVEFLSTERGCGFYW
jgi:hypothetical protein